MAKKNIKNDIVDEVKTGFDGDISTMQDDLAQVMKNRNKKEGFMASFRKIGNRSNEIQHELAEVYADIDGEIPDMTKLEHTEKPLWQKILYWLTAFFAVAFFASLIGFLVFSNLNKETFTNDRVVFKIEPPLSIVSGQDSLYTIIITNNERVNLYDLNIELRYPDSFQYVSATPEAAGEKKNSWSIGVLKIGESVKIEFKGKMIAPLNSVHNLSAVMNFKPENINSEFQQKDSLDLGVNASVINLNITGPDKLLSNQNGDYIITVRNIGVEVLENVEIIAEYPQGFVLTSSTPQSKNGANGTWEINKLATSTENSTSSDRKIVINGNFSGVSESGNQELKIKANLKQEGDWILQSEQSAITNIIKDQLKLTLVVNGSGEDQSVSFGDLIFYTASFKNTGHEDLKNVVLSAHLNSEILDWDTLKDDALGKKTGNTLSWTGKQLPQLLSLRPGEESSVSWQIRVKDFESIKDENIGKMSVESYLEADVSVEEVNTVITSKTITSSINSDLNISAAARYYNEDNLALGAGPIKPQVGEASSYNIKISLNNNIHDISNIEVSAVLPAGVNWDNKEDHDTGDVSYNSKTRRLTWTISRLSKRADGASVAFNISITPKESDSGRVLVLIPEIKLSGKDMETGTDLSKTIKAITTAFDDPILGKVSGIVE
jgi:uncharacterized repeat protein (TIGR01451 family)